VDISSEGGKIFFFCCCCCLLRIKKEKKKSMKNAYILDFVDTAISFNRNGLGSGSDIDDDIDRIGCVPRKQFIDQNVRRANFGPCTVPSHNLFCTCNYTLCKKKKKRLRHTKRFWIDLTKKKTKDLCFLSQKSSPKNGEHASQSLTCDFAKHCIHALHEIVVQVPHRRVLFIFLKRQGEAIDCVDFALPNLPQETSNDSLIRVFCNSIVVVHGAEQYKGMHRHRGGDVLCGLSCGHFISTILDYGTTTDTSKSHDKVKSSKQYTV
jgi:hypothetical protein